MSDFIQEKLRGILRQNTSASEFIWLNQKGESSALELMTAFVAAPRHLAKKIVSVSAEEVGDLDLLITGFSIEGWSLVRLSRVWLLSRLNYLERSVYIKNIETLFDTAEMNELVALYSALPILSYPDQWLARAADAVRSNMGFVFDAIAFHNPYPEKYFGEPAWNQLVLKTIFNDKPIHFIHGLYNRCNENLAVILSDFAHERWAAGRSVAPQVWRLASKFMNDTLVSDMAYLLESGYLANQEAAAIACGESGYFPASQLLSNYPELKELVKTGQLTWSKLETTDLNTYVHQPK